MRKTTSPELFRAPSEESSLFVRLWLLRKVRMKRVLSTGVDWKVTEKQNSVLQVQTRIFKPPMKIKLVLVFICSLDRKSIASSGRWEHPKLLAFSFPGFAAAQLELDEATKISPLKRRQQIPFGLASCGSLLRTRVVGLAHYGYPVFEAFKNIPKYQKPFTAQQKKQFRVRCPSSSASQFPSACSTFPKDKDSLSLTSWLCAEQWLFLTRFILGI